MSNRPLIYGIEVKCILLCFQLPGEQGFIASSPAPCSVHHTIFYSFFFALVPQSFHVAQIA